MTRNDTAIRRGTTGIVSAVGAFAGADSYVHVYGLARDWHQNIVSAAFLPLTADGVVLAASAVMLTASKRGQDIPLRARAWFWTGTLATIAGNAASGWPHGFGAALLATWPVIAYIGCMELLTWMLQHLGAQPKKAAPKTRIIDRPKPATFDAAPPPIAPEPEDAPADELGERRRSYAPRLSLEVLCRKAEEEFADALAAGTVPGQRKVATTLSVGGEKADQIRKHLQTVLAAAASLSFA